MERYAKELGDLPLLYNGQLLPVQEIQKFGFKLTIYSATLMAPIFGCGTPCRTQDHRPDRHRCGLGLL